MYDALGSTSVPVYWWLPDDPAHLPCHVVGRPAVRESVTPGVATLELPVTLLGRRIADEDAQAQLDALGDELLKVLGGSKNRQVERPVPALHLARPGDGVRRRRRDPRLRRHRRHRRPDLLGGPVGQRDIPDRGRQALPAVVDTDAVGYDTDWLAPGGDNVTEVTAADYTTGSDLSCQVTLGRPERLEHGEHGDGAGDVLRPGGERAPAGHHRLRLDATILQDPHISDGVSRFLFEHDTESRVLHVGAGGRGGAPGDRGVPGDRRIVRW